MILKMGKSDMFNRYYNLLILFIWVVLYLTLLVLSSATQPFKEAFVTSTTFIVLSLIIVTFISKVLLPRALKRKKMSLFAIQVLVAMLVVTMLFVVFVEDFDKPSYIEISSLGMKYSMLYGFVASLPSAMLIVGGFCGFEFYKQLTLQQSSHLEEQLQFLKNQVNPHLMFNVFNHLHILMEKNTELASDLLVQFSDVLRYQLYECNNDRVFLEQEVKYLHDVIAIERMRWGNELEINATFEVEDGKKQIAPLILITFVENAFKHVSRLPSKIGYVDIRLKQEGDTLDLVVENSNTERQVRTTNSGIGLNNTTKRLSIIYPKEHNLSIHAASDIYRVDLRLNLK